MVGKTLILVCVFIRVKMVLVGKMGRFQVRGMVWGES